MAVSPSSRSASPKASLDLPSLHPLDHSHPLLSAASTAPFDADAFLLSRLPAPLPDVRDELRAYQAQLKAELVELINLDYREFVALGTGLKGEGRRLEKVRRPLAAIRDDVQVVRSSLEESEERLEGMLEERRVLREEKTLVQLLLSLTDSLSRTETLLDLSQASSKAGGALDAAVKPMVLSLVIDATDSAMAHPAAGAASFSAAASGAAREKVVGRVAAEYTRVLYLSDKARKEGCALLSEVDWRIERIRNTLHRDLDHLFSDTLASVGRSASSTHERETLSECLKTYALVEGWRDAEELFKREVVRPLVRRLISAGTLDTPVNPRQALGVSPSIPSPSSPAPLPSPAVPSTPRVPETPATPSAAIHDPFDLAPAIHLQPPASSPPAARVDQTPLEGLYRRLLAAFSKPEITLLLHVAALLPNAAGGGRSSVDVSDDEGEDGLDGSGGASAKCGFEFFAGVIWKEVGERLMDELGGLLFAAGRPSELHQHYTQTHAFFSEFEALAPSPRSVLAMRQSPTYKTFEARWGLAVYFQLRWKEIVLPLEEALSSNVTGAEKQQDGMYFAQSRATLKALETGWANDIFIPALAYRFWKLSLQILSRYRGFVSAQIPSTGPSKPLPSTDTSATDASQTAEDDRCLRIATLLVKELGSFRGRAWSVWESCIEGRVGRDKDEEAEDSPQDAYNISLDSLSALSEPLSRAIVLIAVRRCAESLRLVRSVASQYRSAGVKREPKEASYFVPAILKPLRDYLGGLGAEMEEKVKIGLRRAVVDEVSQSYSSTLAAVRESEEKLTQLRKGRKTAFSLFGSSTSAADEAKDAARIRTQMELDVTAFREDARALGVGVDESAALHALVESVAQERRGAATTESA